MSDEDLIAELNRGYVCPADAGPMWRAACDYGFDMSLVADALRASPEERMAMHQHALNTLLQLKEGRESAAE